MAVWGESRYAPAFRTKSRQGIPRLLGDNPSVVFGRQALHSCNDESCGGIGLDPPSANHMKLHPAFGKAAQVVQGRGQIPGKSIEVVHHDGSSTGSLDPLSQPVEALSAAARHAIVRQDLDKRPPVLLAVGLYSCPLVLEGDRPGTRLLAATDVSESDHRV